MHISCTICTELYQSNEETGLTKCGHLFHINCVKPWLQKHKTCPHCRADTSVNDLIRVFFTEISAEDVHLNRNCKSNSLEAIIASEKEYVKNIKIDLRQAENDLIDMNKHIERYENEVKHLKIFNDSLLENNEKIECENKKLSEQLKNHQALYSYQGEYENLSSTSSNEEECDIIELKTIIASYEEANQRNTNQLEHLQKELNKTIIQNEELQFELHKLKDENRKHEIILKEKEEEKGSQDVSQKKKQEMEVKNLKGKMEFKIIDRHLKYIKKQHTINLKNNKIPESDSKKPTSESFRKAREAIAKLKSCSLPAINNAQQSDLNDTIFFKNSKEAKNNLELEKKKLKEGICTKPFKYYGYKTHQTDLKALFQNNQQKFNNEVKIFEARSIKPESNTLKKKKNENFRKAKNIFAEPCLLSLTNSAKESEVNSARKDNSFIRPPMPPPRTLKPFSMLPVRPPFPPPRYHTEKILTNNQQIQLRKPALQNPFTIDNVIKSSVAQDCKNEQLQINKDKVKVGIKEENIQKDEQKSTRVNVFLNDNITLD